MSGTKTLPCPVCGKRSSGNFCQHCGTELGGGFCRQCGAELDGRFCSQCGAAAGKVRVPPDSGRRAVMASSKGSTDISWWIAGGALFIIAFAIALNAVTPDDPAVQLAPGSLAAPPPTDFSQMTPRQTADEFFNRVMTASDAGDAATVEQFLPLALEAYETVGAVDLDVTFHVSLLHRAGGDYEASLASAEEILAAEPNHILGLDAAAKAAIALGRDAAAADYYERILANVDTEMTRPIFEYQSHSRYFEVARQEAIAFLGSR